MPRFTVRTELHGIPSNESQRIYGELHTAMKDKGYYQYVESGNGIFYELPTAEYNHDVSHAKNLHDVRSEVMETVTNVLSKESTEIQEKNTSPTVLVTEGVRAWSLKRIQKPS